MNLIGHIPGVGPTAPFSPGPNTPAPWNVAHTGATDGAGPATATKNMSEIYNRLLLQVAAVIQKSGLAIDNENWTQLADAVVLISGPFATNAEAQALASAVVKLSPATLAAAFKGSNQSLTTNGYQKLPGGLILQWGSSVATLAGAAFTFPLTFPTDCYTLAVSNNGGTSGYNWLTTATPSVTGGVMQSNTANNAYSYIAIGK